MLHVGDSAPDFKLMNAAGELIHLSNLLGKMVVLYFYPKDDTSGCTAEALDFTAHQKDFEKAGAIILGISPDGVKSHKKFIDKHKLGIELLSDDEKQVVNAYSVWVEKSMYGRKYMGVERSTFLLGPDGKIIKLWRKVKVKGHIEAVLEAVKNA